MLKYGAASKYQFDDPTKWVTVSSVPLLDEHVMTDENGKPVARVDKKILELIARNNNERVRQTGDPATLILGHTSDDPRAPEKPSRGFAVNYQVKPYRRDPETGAVIYAIHGDYKVRPKHAHIIEDYPRRSVELWWNKKEIDPVALLGGTSPERDLSVIIRNSRKIADVFRINNISFDHVPSDPRLREAQKRADNVLKFSRRGDWCIESYNCPSHTIRMGRTMAKPKRYQNDFGSGSQPGSQFGDDGADDLNEYDPGDEMPDDDGMDQDEGEEATDPGTAAIFQTKQWKMMEQQMADVGKKLGMLMEALQGPEQGMDDGMEGDTPLEGEDQGMDEMPPPGPPGGDGMGMEGMDDEGEGMPDEESRRAQGKAPVQFMNGGTNMAGPRNSNIPAFGKKYSKTKPKKEVPMTRTPQKRNDPEIVALRRELAGLKLQYARTKAEQTVAALEQDGVLFGDSAEEAITGKEETTEYLAYLSTQSQEDFNKEVEVIQKRYKRRKANPGSPTSVGLARFTRSSNGVAPKVESDDDYDPANPMEAADFVDLQQTKGYSRTDAIKFMRQNRAKYADYDEGFVQPDSL